MDNNTLNLQAIERGLTAIALAVKDRRGPIVWTPLTFQNSWVDFGAGAAPCAYTKDDMGFVHLKGLMKSGTFSVAAFTLPVGFRPGGTLRFIAFSNGSWAPVDLNSAGQFIPYPGSNLSFGLDGITFYAEA